MSTENISLEGAGVLIDFEFPEEAHPAETITLNLTITALVGLKLQNFTMVIEVLVDTGWRQFYKEQVLQLSMVQNDSFARQFWFTLPQDANESLCCKMYVLTDKAPGLPPGYFFYITQVRNETYTELLTKYTELRDDYNTTYSSYTSLLAQYGGLNSSYNLLRATFESLNSSFFTQKASYDTLKASYDSLETNYNVLNQTHYALINENDGLKNTVDAQNTELTTMRGIVYALIAATVILVAVVVNIRKAKSEPYVVVRKETVALKPNEG